MGCNQEKVKKKKKDRKKENSWLSHFERNPD